MKQQLNLVSLDVDDFTDQVGGPSDADISELFAQYSKKFPKHNHEHDGPKPPRSVDHIHGQIKT